jgi:DNA topoisomerase-1
LFGVAVFFRKGRNAGVTTLSVTALVGVAGRRRKPTPAKSCVMRVPRFTCMKKRSARRYSRAGGTRAARKASLRYVLPGESGYTRRRNGRGFVFLDAAGHPVTAAVRRRIARLPIPPAWTSVWISLHGDAHILATGRDARGRKQYLYHPGWHAHRSLTNFHRMEAFGRALSVLRARVERDLRRPGLLRERVLAVAIRLIDVTHLRVGGEEYARTNRTYGITTLLDRHLRGNGRSLELTFRAKGGRTCTVSVHDSRLARLLRRCEDLPGQRLLQYVDASGSPCAVASDDVNAYIRETMGGGFTAKDFRTWGGTVAAVEYLLVHAAAAPVREQVAKDAVEHAARHLGDTVAVTRKHYVHPAVLDAFRAGALPLPPRGRRGRLGASERVALRILRGARRRR